MQHFDFECDKYNLLERRLKYSSTLTQIRVKFKLALHQHYLHPTQLSKLVMTFKVNTKLGYCFLNPVLEHLHKLN